MESADPPAALGPEPGAPPGPAAASPAAAGDAATNDEEANTLPYAELLTQVVNKAASEELTPCQRTKTTATSPTETWTLIENSKKLEKQENMIKNETGLET